MTATPHPDTLAIRDRQRQNASALGIDEAYISTLVDTFYGRIRAHPVLGPIFNEAIADNWDPHLDRMKRFWESVALSAGAYHGKPVPAHLKHVGRFGPQHFPIWLELFRQVLDETAKSPGAVPYFMERAERIAASLQMAVFESSNELGVPVLRATDAPLLETRN